MYYCLHTLYDQDGVVSRGSLKALKTLVNTARKESSPENENADKLNPPMEKRNKEILTKDLKEKSLELKKEIEMRNIPDITTKIEFKE